MDITIIDKVENKNVLYRPDLEFDEKYCEDIINHCNKGLSPATFGGSLGVSNDKIVEWIKKYPSFKEAYGIAQMVELKFWEETLQTAAANQDREYVMIAKFMLNTRQALYLKFYKSSIVTDLPTDMTQGIKSMSDFRKDRDITKENENFLPDDFELSIDAFGD